MSYAEATCTVLLSSQPTHHYPGAPLRLVTSGARSIPSPIPSPRLPLRVSDTQLSANLRCFPAIFEEPHGSGIHPFLFISTSFVPAQQAVHAAALAKQETHPGWKCHWLGPGHLTASWVRTSPDLPFVFRGISAQLTKPMMSVLESIYGDWNVEANWLAAALLPRRRGATILMPTPTLMQLWIRLF